MLAIRNRNSSIDFNLKRSPTKFQLAVFGIAQIVPRQNGATTINDESPCASLFRLENIFGCSVVSRSYFMLELSPNVDGLPNLAIEVLSEKFFA